MLLLSNKKAHTEYEIEKTLYAGVLLTGPEVKSLRNKSGSLVGSYVKIIGNEAFLLNSQITPYAFAVNVDYDPKRTRKLLLKKKEIVKLLETQEQKKRTLVALSFELHNNKIKLKMGVGRGLKQFEKREKIKKRDEQREVGWAVKRYL